MALVCLFLPIVLGCGEPVSENYTVTGIVTYQGKPLPTGSVMFVSQNKNQKTVAAPINAQGRYQLEAADGEYLVQVQMAARLRGAPAPKGEFEGAQLDVPEVDWLIPEKYAHCRTSGLKAVVKPEPNNQVDLPLK